MNPLLANFQAMRHTGPLYAAIDGTHFVEAQKLILEGGRRYMDQSDGKRLQLLDSDKEGSMIQSHGVAATVYSAKLWEDSAALLAIMREDNLNYEMALPPAIHLPLGEIWMPMQEITLDILRAIMLEDNLAPGNR